MWTGDRDPGEAIRGLSLAGAAFSRWRWVFAAWIALSVVAAVAYTQAVRPEFVATVKITLVPSLIANDGPEDQRHYHQFALDSEQADTELRAMRSDTVLRQVFDRLDLAGAPELASAQNGFWSIVTHWLHGLVPGAVAYDERNRAFVAFVDRVRTLRLGLSYVIAISYRSHDAARAAKVANAVASAYVADRLQRTQARLAQFGPYRTGRTDALAIQTLAALEGVHAGSIPTVDPLLSDVRLLGPAVIPVGKAYPKLALTVVLAVSFAGISGALAVLTFAMPTLRRRRRSRLVPTGSPARPSLEAA